MASLAVNALDPVPESGPPSTRARPFVTDER
jgi:hypothetical protein